MCFTLGYPFSPPPQSNSGKKLASEPTPQPEKKISSKVTKAQRRAQQAEFNRQLWAEAYDDQCRVMRAQIS